MTLLSLNRHVEGGALTDFNRLGYARQDKSSQFGIGVLIGQHQPRGGQGIETKSDNRDIDAVPVGLFLHTFQSGCGAYAVFSRSHIPPARPRRSTFGALVRQKHVSQGAASRSLHPTRVQWGLSVSSTTLGRFWTIPVYGGVTPAGTGSESQIVEGGSGRPGGRARAKQRRHTIQLPIASVTHFLVKLSFAAPASFFSAAVLSQADFASVSHFFMKLVIAAPASFLFVASTLHDAAYALPQVIKNAVTRASAFIAVLLV